MAFELPFTNHQMKKVSFYVTAVSIAVFTVLLLGNIITAAISDSTTVNDNSYTTRDGFPIFQNQEEYIRFIRSYPHKLGIKLTIHKMREGESFWNIIRRHRISLDTLIGANPFLKTLEATAGKEIIIPSIDGTLLPFDNFYDVVRMKELLNYEGKIYGSYLPTPFRLISTDDMRLVFFKGSKPVVVNSTIESLYKYRIAFQMPINGTFTSLFGDRVDPYLHGTRFHNGIDILGRHGRAIKPIREGIVTYTGWRSGYGKTVIIQHHDGYSSLYGHLSHIRVKKGDWVKKKDSIGNVGSTGRSTGAHLHFTFMKHGEAVNPIFFIW